MIFSNRLKGMKSNLILYHLSPRKYLNSILNLGLIPAKSKGLTVQMPKEWRMSVVWLTNDPEYILKEQAGANWIKKHNPIIFTIDCAALKLENWAAPPEECNEWIHYGSIEKSRIIKYEPTKIIMAS